MESNNSFLAYLEEKSIHLVDDFGEATVPKHKITEGMVEEQLDVISEFHSKACGYNQLVGARLQNCTGKLLEKYKVYIKKLERDLKNIKEYGIKNEFENIENKFGYDTLERAKEVMAEAGKCNYVSLISRSMKKVEVCAGNCYFTNLRKNGDIIELKNISNCCYDMNEIDVVRFLSRLKRKGISLDWGNLIETFCMEDALDSDSVRIILALVSYPYEFIKCCNRYRERVKGWTNSEYADRLNKAVAADGNSLI